MIYYVLIYSIINSYYDKESIICIYIQVSSLYIYFLLQFLFLRWSKFTVHIIILYFSTNINKLIFIPQLLSLFSLLDNHHHFPQPIFSIRPLLATTSPALLASLPPPFHVSFQPSPLRDTR